jgi:hypothetical protein
MAHLCVASQGLQSREVKFDLTLAGSPLAPLVLPCIRLDFNTLPARCCSPKRGKRPILHSINESQGRAGEFYNRVGGVLKFRAVFAHLTGFGATRSYELGGLDKW